MVQHPDTALLISHLRVAIGNSVVTHLMLFVLGAVAGQSIRLFADHAFLRVAGDRAQRRRRILGHLDVLPHERPDASLWL